MKRFCGMIVLCILTGSAGYAQRVYIENNYYVIDAVGLPASGVKTTADVTSRTLDGNGRVYRHSNVKPGDSDNTGTGNAGNPDVNEKVSPKFAVSHQNINSSGSTTTLTPTVTWLQASGWGTDASGNLNASATPADTGCPMYTGPSGNEKGLWRLPTLRELLLIWILNDRLNTLSGFTPFGGYYYWTATENNNSAALALNFNTALTTIAGATASTAKTGTNRLRCVRDL